MQPLPIDAQLPAIVAALRAARNLVLVAEPGAGKTTRLPRALLDAGFAEQGEIVVLEPRRIAARMAARRVAEELGEAVGERIGYQVRFEDKSSKRTRVRFVTEGVLTRKLIADPALRGVSTVLLDEFHERHLQGDLALALLRRLQRTREEPLSLCVMSATLEAEPVARFLDCAVVNVPGRRFEVALEYADKPDERPLELRVAGAVRRLLRDDLDGDVLVFLPGAAEIRRAREALDALAREAGLYVAVLHGDLPPEEQDRALAPSMARKVILSTNLAESSLTIEGVCAVIDSGLARVAGHSAYSGLPTLNTAKVSRASATQRAGRAGRLRAGRCIRLYTKSDHDARPLHDKPEIVRADLAETMLAVQAIDQGLAPSDWLEPPPVDAWNAALTLNRLLGALDANLALTPQGRRLLRWPLHPRLARIAIEAELRGAGRRGCALAALLSERDIMLGTRARFDERGRDVEAGPSDALQRLELFEEAEARRFDAGSLRANALDAGAVRAVARTRDRLLRNLDRDSHDTRDDDEPLLVALLAGYGDRVAKRRNKGGTELVFARGGSASQAQESAVRDAELLIVLDASERPKRGVVAHLVSAIEPEWLLELFPEQIVDQTEYRFDSQSERVEAAHSLRFESILLDESRSFVVGSEAERVLFDAALARGAERFDEDEAIEAFERRVAFAARVSKTLPPLPDDARKQALRRACEGKASFSELRETGVLPSLRSLVAPEHLALIERLTPDSVQLRSGKRLPVHYEADRPPWIQSRLQDFFGLHEGPKVGDHPLVLHLLAPNQRALQVTTDLAGFWQRHYPELRRQLMRRYPRHAWPEDPLHAEPSEPRRGPRK